MSATHSALVIGGGFFGLSVALRLRELGVVDVLVLEAGPELMGRASYVNQARVHNGYHYPRSLLTGFRSQVNHPVFRGDFADAIVDDFPHLYAIARRLSKVNARQFELFVDRIGAPLEPAPPEFAALFEDALVEAAYLVREPAFDSRVVRAILEDRIAETGGIEVRLNDEVDHLASGPGETVVVTSTSGEHQARTVVSAVYSRLNELHRRSGLPQIPVQHEIAEMPLVRLPAGAPNIAVTVMDGPFFSLMPFPSRGLHTLSHVRYTPHHRWRETQGQNEFDPYEVLRVLDERSRFDMMAADVRRFLPRLGELEPVDSIVDVKTVLSRSDNDDSRPILYKPDFGLKNYTCIMGGKLDNIYDVLQELTIFHGSTGPPP